MDVIVLAMVTDTIFRWKDWFDILTLNVFVCISLPFLVRVVYIALFALIYLVNTLWVSGYVRDIWNACCDPSWFLWTLKLYVVWFSCARKIEMLPRKGKTRCSSHFKADTGGEMDKMIPHVGWIRVLKMPPHTRFEYWGAVCASKFL